MNHSPRWYWWVGANVVVPPGDMENVSASKMPRTVAWPKPRLSALTSVWYHDTPNGLSGCWITNRSKSALRGMPKIETCMVSFCDPGMMVTRPPACGRQDLMPGEGTRANVNAPVWPVALVTGAADAAVRLRPPATAVKVVMTEALQLLSPAHREVLNETILRDRTLNEAAETLGIPVGTVKSRVYYALRALRVVLAERGVPL